MQVYLAGPIFSSAERDWLGGLAAAVRADGFDCFAPHEHLDELSAPTPAAIYALDAGYASKIHYWTTPQTKCVDGSGSDCTAYSEWVTKWQEIKG